MKDTMMSPTSERAKKIRLDFEAAIDRLKRGEPTSPALAKRAATGRLKISPSSVALEAGHSRTLIGCKVSAYGDIRGRIADAASSPRARLSEADVVASLQDTIRKLRDELAVAQTLLAAQRIAIDALGSRDTFE